MSSVDILVAPYNYITDNSASKIELENKILVIDEAHNFEQLLESTGSFSITSNDLAQSYDEVSFAEHDVFCKELADRSRSLRWILKVIDTIKAELENHANQSESDASYQLKIDEIIEVFVKAEAFFIQSEVWNAVSAELNKYYSKPSTLSRMTGDNFGYFVHLISELEMVRKDDLCECYGVTISVGRIDDETAKMKLKLFNLEPKIGMNKIEKNNLYNIICTSGTLSPVEDYARLLNLDHNGEREVVLLSNSHVIDKEQLFVATVANRENIEFLNVYANRENRQMHTAYRQSLADLANCAPAGTLFFHSTYSQMESCETNWKYFLSEFHKKMYFESRSQKSTAMTVESFRKEIAKENGTAILNCVISGKCSEGVNFTDDLGRLSVICGIPYPPKNDPRIIQKRAYLDNLVRTKKGSISGAQWYTINASRAVSQAIGRIIRHKYDFGSIIFMDRRFGSDVPHNFRSYLPTWLGDVQSMESV
ncbi:unnamed protein product [Oikopleura dioica]|uniref:ATP-dependent helicase C-terminal domain-containing protein n=1 Tax=Oikopleura dioica TaxID=34765 RepID=E4XTC3_OIKDI|nr:unnamed protein product [Oikopleura dioica]